MERLLVPERLLPPRVPVEPHVQRDARREYSHAAHPQVRGASDPGVDDGLPDGSAAVLDASVGAFTRLWLGVRPASGLALTDELVGPPELVAALDAAFCLPPPLPDWPY